MTWLIQKIQKINHVGPDGIVRKEVEYMALAGSFTKHGSLEVKVHHTRCVLCTVTSNKDDRLVTQ